MAAQPGSDLLLKLGSANHPPTYVTVAGLKTTQVSINGDAVLITNSASGGWRDLLSGAGVRSVSVAATGIFIGTTAESAIRNQALNGSLAPYLLTFEGNEQMSGNFLITTLNYTGDVDGERNFSLSLESSGPVFVD